MNHQTGNNNAAENDESLLCEEDEEEKVKDGLLEQDQQRFGLLAQLIAGASFLPVTGFNRKKRLFDSLKDPNVADRLFDLDNPVKLYRIRHQLREAEGILKEKGSLKRGRAEARLLFWKTSLTPEEYRRTLYSTVVARSLHRSVGRREREIKIQAAVGRFGLSEPNATTLRSNLAGWMKENPGKSIDGYLLTEGRKSCLTQCAQQGTQVDRGNLIEREKNLAEDLSKARKKAIEEAKEKIAKGKQITAEILNPQNPELTIHQLREKINRNIIPEERITQLQQQLSDLQANGANIMSVDVVKRKEELRQIQEAQAAKPTATPVPAPPAPKPSPPVAPTAPIALVPNRLSTFLDKLKTRLFGRIPSIPILGKLRNIFKFNLRNLIVDKLLKSAAFTAVKTALKGFATGGIGLAVDLGLALARQIPIVRNVVAVAETGVRRAVIVAASCIVGVVLFIIMPLLDGPDLLSSVTIDNPVIINSSGNSIPSLFNKNLTWEGFEKKFLITIKEKQTDNQPQLTWQQFEMENLVFGKSFLSLDADRHDQVKK